MAIKDFTSAISLGVEDANYYSNRGYAFRQLKKYREAIDDFTESIRLNRKQGAAYVGRGFAFYKSGRQHEARVDFLQAAEYFRDCGKMQQFHQIIYLIKILRRESPFTSKALLT